MNIHTTILLALLCGAWLPSALAQADPEEPVESQPAELLAQGLAAAQPLVLPAPSPLPYRAIELYGSRQKLSAGLGDWHETGVRGVYQLGNHMLGAEAATMRRFGESGAFVGLSDTVIFSPDWFGAFSVGAGDGASYLPRYRLDAFINRKFLDARNLVGTLGAGYYRAPDGHVDRSASVGATYYFEQPWVVQAEIRFNNSSPGAVNTRQQFVAATWGRDKQTQVTGRYGWGSEGYQAIGAGAALVDFRSRQASLALRHWFGPAWGVTAAVERYSNPFYKRNGLTAGLFWQFQ